MNTNDAAAALRISLPTFRKRVRALGIKPAFRDDYGTKLWRPAQVEAIGNIQATCPWCASPYHTRCSFADTKNADQLRARIASLLEIVDWDERKREARKL